MKAAFRAIGIECGATRPPMTLAAADGAARMAEVVKRAAIREWLSV
jgi:N-acetylneuraminate lyase